MDRTRAHGKEKKEKKKEARKAGNPKPQEEECGVNPPAGDIAGKEREMGGMVLPSSGKGAWLRA
jgi:hypothetical protein